MNHEGCRQVLIDAMARRGAEVLVSTEPLITRNPYLQQPLRCPHGVDFHAAPTSDQIIAWSTDGAA